MTVPDAPICAHCDAADSLELVTVQAQATLTFVCRCCAKETVVESAARVEEPPTDVSGQMIDGP